MDTNAQVGAKASARVGDPALRRVAWALGAALVLLAPDARGSNAGDTPAVDALFGLWASSTTFGPELRGELTVVRDGDRWRATIGDATAAASGAGDVVRLEFAGDRGRFRGGLVEGGSTIDGFWLQPAGLDAKRPNPVGSRQAFATPVRLVRASAGVWRGAVVPLEQRFSLYLKIYRDAEGAPVAAFRNPDFNSNGGAMLFQAARQGDQVVLSRRFDDGSPEIRHTATLARNPDRLQLFWPDVGQVLELVRRAPGEEAGFLPRPPAEPRYRYRAPASTGDGWTTAAAGEVGFDEAALAGLIERLGAADPAVRRPSLIHSLLVARRGKLVLEEYFFGHERDQPHDLRSAGKTFASVLLGAAMRKGVRIAPETKVFELLRARGPFGNPDSRKARIDLGHLMTHTAGFACNDYDDASPGNENTMQGQTAQPDLWKFTLDLPMAHEPGARYAYCSANTNLMGAALTTATGTWLPELFEREIARPLDFGPYHWNLMANGEGYLGGGAFLRPRDLLKVGQTYLDGGVWRGRRIVEAAWVEQSTAPRVHIDPARTGLSPEQFGEQYGEADDAYAWHLGAARAAPGAGATPSRDYQASGNGGQLLLVIPRFDLVVVFTGGNYGQGGIWGRWGSEIVDGAIIPAIRN